MRKKVVFIGGGSAKFVRTLVVDLLGFEPLRDARIALMDIDKERLARAERIVAKIIREAGAAASVESTTNQRAALDGADYVIVTVMVGGLAHYHSDVAIPAKYGILQNVSDTIGPGGVFRMVRTAPVLKQMADDLKAVAPDAWVLNYANPMAMNTGTLLRCGHARTVGLCHSIQGAYKAIARWLGIPHEGVRYTAGGINHVNFYLTLEHEGRDLYSELLAGAARVIAEHPEERVRFELLEHLGHWPAEGPHHQSEYTAWFLKDRATADRYGATPFWGYEVDSKGNEERDREVDDQLAGRRPIRFERSQEYGAEIIHSIETGTPRMFYGNVRNRGLIRNLPAEAVVEVPCIADVNGVAPCRVGRIPPQLAAVMAPHTHVHEMAVEGALTQNRRLIRQAVQADPLTGALLTLPQIARLVDELFAENRAYTRGWAAEGGIESRKGEGRKSRSRRSKVRKSKGACCVCA
ncbi:MAG: alpha-galactosidase [Kiritimatiellae bacterium]|nr:alpha-galactosidase [Kiritimatiellia bacterium]